MPEGLRLAASSPQGFPAHPFRHPGDHAAAPTEYGTARNRSKPLKRRGSGAVWDAIAVAVGCWQVGSARAAPASPRDRGHPSRGRPTLASRPSLARGRSTGPCARGCGRWRRARPARRRRAGPAAGGGTARRGARIVAEQGLDGLAQPHRTAEGRGALMGSDPLADRLVGRAARGARIFAVVQVASMGRAPRSRLGRRGGAGRAPRCCSASARRPAGRCGCRSPRPSGEGVLGEHAACLMAPARWRRSDGARPMAPVDQGRMGLDLAPPTRRGTGPRRRPRRPSAPPDVAPCGARSRSAIRRAAMGLSAKRSGAAWTSSATPEPVSIIASRPWAKAEGPCLALGAAAGQVERHRLGRRAHDARGVGHRAVQIGEMLAHRARGVLAGPLLGARHASGVAGVRPHEAAVHGHRLGRRQPRLEAPPDDALEDRAHQPALAEAPAPVLRDGGVVGHPAVEPQAVRATGGRGRARPPRTAAARSGPHGDSPPAACAPSARGRSRAGPWRCGAPPCARAPRTARAPRRPGGGGDRPAPAPRGEPRETQRRPLDRPSHHSAAPPRRSHRGKWTMPARASAGPSPAVPTGCGHPLGPPPGSRLGRGWGRGVGCGPVGAWLPRSSPPSPMSRSVAGLRVSTPGANPRQPAGRGRERGLRRPPAPRRRRGLAQLVGRLEEGDALVVARLDRPGRDAMDAAATVRALSGLGLRVPCLALGGVDLTSSTGKPTMGVIDAVAEFERDRLVARARAGLARARAEGKRIGRPLSLTPDRGIEAVRPPRRRERLGRGPRPRHLAPDRGARARGGGGRVGGRCDCRRARAGGYPHRR